MVWHMKMLSVMLQKWLNTIHRGNMEIELMGWIGEDMSDEEIITYIDELEAEEEARIELADMARDGWR